MNIFKKLFESNVETQKAQETKDAGKYASDDDSNIRKGL
jgi:hypothetical protein